MFKKTNNDIKSTISEENEGKISTRKTVKKVIQKEIANDSLQAAKDEKLFSLYQYVSQYLDALDEERVDNQRILVKVIRKIERDLNSLFKE